MNQILKRVHDSKEVKKPFKQRYMQSDVGIRGRRAIYNSLASQKSAPLKSKSDQVIPLLKFCSGFLLLLEERPNSLKWPTEPHLVFPSLILPQTFFVCSLYSSHADP